MSDVPYISEKESKRLTTAQEGVGTARNRHLHNERLAKLIVPSLRFLYAAFPILQEHAQSSKKAVEVSNPGIILLKDRLTRVLGGWTIGTYDKTNSGDSSAGIQVMLGDDSRLYEGKSTSRTGGITVVTAREPRQLKPTIQDHLVQDSDVHIVESMTSGYYDKKVILYGGAILTVLQREDSIRATVNQLLAPSGVQIDGQQ